MKTIGDNTTQIPLIRELNTQDSLFFYDIKIVGVPVQVYTYIINIKIDGQTIELSRISFFFTYMYT